MNLTALVINEKDNMANLVGPGKKGDTVECVVEGVDGSTTITLCDDIPSNHKFAFVDIAKGDLITKYGLTIGTASADIAQGHYVHDHNVDSNRGRGDLK